MVLPSRIIETPQEICFPTEPGSSIRVSPKAFLTKARRSTVMICADDNVCKVCAAPLTMESLEARTRRPRKGHMEAYRVHTKCAFCVGCGTILSFSSKLNSTSHEGVPNSSDFDAIRVDSSEDSTPICYAASSTSSPTDEDLEACPCKYYEWSSTGLLRPSCRSCWRASRIATGMSVRQVDAEENTLIASLKA